MEVDKIDQPFVKCGAKTRSGKPCETAPMPGKRRCRIHGGAVGSGAPRGNKNSLKHGYYTAKAIAERQAARRLVAEVNEFLDQVPTF